MQEDMPPSAGDAEPVNAPVAVANGEQAAAGGEGGGGEGGEGAAAGGDSGVEQPYQGKVSCSCLPTVWFESCPRTPVGVVRKFEKAAQRDAAGLYPMLR